MSRLPAGQFKESELFGSPESRVRKDTDNVISLSLSEDDQNSDALHKRPLYTKSTINLKTGVAKERGITIGVSPRK